MKTLCMFAVLILFAAPASAKTKAKPTAGTSDAERRASAAKIVTWAKHAQANLDNANATINALDIHAADLQKQIDVQADEKAAAEAARDKAQADAKKKQAVIDSKNRVIFWLTLPLALLSAGFALYVLLTLKAPTWPLPYGLGLIVTIAAPALTFSAVMLILRFI